MPVFRPTTGDHESRVWRKLLTLPKRSSDRKWPDDFARHPSPTRPNVLRVAVSVFNTGHARASFHANVSRWREAIVRRMTATWQE
jgi:hypothetical protein